MEERGADPKVEEPLASLLARVQELAGLVPAECSAGLQREAVLDHVALLGRLESALTAWVGAFDAAAVHAADGARTAAGWMAASTEADRGWAGAVVHRARDLRSCPAVEAAWASGRLGTAKVRALLDARGVHPERFAEDEAGLVDTIAPLTVAHARIVAARWKHLAEETKAYKDAQRAAAAAAGGSGATPRPDDDDRAGGGAGADDGDGTDDACGGDGGDGTSGGDGAGGAGGGEPAAEPEPEPDPAAANRLHLSQTFQGRWALEGDLDPVSGAELAEAIAAFIDARFREGTWSSGDGLTAGFRRAHALLELVGRGTSAASRHGDPRPSVVVRIDPATLAGLPADDLAAGLARDCCLDDGTPVDARAIERLLCTARVQALWTRIREDGSVETLGVTDLLRDATRAQRRALKARDGRCVFPGCGAEADWCEAHHLVPHEDLGPTLMVNLVLLCRFHHHLVHEGGWTLWRDERSGELHLVDPEHRPRPITPPGTKVPVLDLDTVAPLHPPPAPPHLHPPRFRTAHDPPGSSRPERSSSGDPPRHGEAAA